MVQVDEDDEPPELRRILDRARKQRLLELQVRAAEADERGAAEEGAEQRRMSLMGASAEGAGPAVSLFRVTQAERGLQLSLVACTSREYISMIGGDELEPEQVGRRWREGGGGGRRCRWLFVCEPRTSVFDFGGRGWYFCIVLSLLLIFPSLWLDVRCLCSFVLSSAWSGERRSLLDSSVFFVF